MNYESLKLNPKTGKRRKIVGRGAGSGHGGTSCKGHKGQKARTGRKGRPGFEGGQMPLIRRMPKRGFNNKFKEEYQIVNLERLNQFKDEALVTPKSLKEENIIKNLKSPVKILGSGTLKKKLTVEAQAFSLSARESIEKAGGQVKEI